jgi:hypothetical protein
MIRLRVGYRAGLVVPVLMMTSVSITGFPAPGFAQEGSQKAVIREISKAQGPNEGASRAHANIIARIEGRSATPIPHGPPARAFRFEVVGSTRLRDAWRVTGGADGSEIDMAKISRSAVSQCCSAWPFGRPAALQISFTNAPFERVVHV